MSGVASKWVVAGVILQFVGVTASGSVKVV